MESEIHISDVRSFLSCRRAWDFSSMLRQGWEPDPTPIHFLVGRLVHTAMYGWYEEGVHPAFTYSQALTKHINEKEPSLGVPDENSYRYQQVQMGLKLVSNYYEWIQSTEEPDEDWETIANEPTFHLPLFNAEGKKSNRISWGGRFDRLARKKSDGTVWLWEFKTTAREPDKEWLKTDNQVTSYLAAAQHIFGFPIQGIHFRFMKKKFPDVPRRIRGGMELSRAVNSGAQGVHTTYDLYVRALEELNIELLSNKFGLKPEELSEQQIEKGLVLLKRDYDNVLTILAARGWEEYFMTFDVAKTQTEVQNATKDLWQIGLQMVRPNVPIYPAPEWQKCRYCHFREPCLEMNAGIDPSRTLKWQYAKRDRNEDDLDLILSYGGEE